MALLLERSHSGSEVSGRSFRRETKVSLEDTMHSFLLEAPPRNMERSHSGLVRDIGNVVCP